MGEDFDIIMRGVVVGTAISAFLYANCVFVGFRLGGIPVGVLLGLLFAELVWSWSMLVYHWKWGRIARGHTTQCSALFGALKLIVVPPIVGGTAGRLEFRAFKNVFVVGDKHIAASLAPKPPQKPVRKQNRRR